MKKELKVVNAGVVQKETAKCTKLDSELQELKAKNAEQAQRINILEQNDLSQTQVSDESFKQWLKRQKQNILPRLLQKPNLHPTLKQAALLLKKKFTCGHFFVK